MWIDFHCTFSARSTVIDTQLKLILRLPWLDEKWGKTKKHKRPEKYSQNSPIWSKLFPFERRIRVNNCRYLQWMNNYVLNSLLDILNVESEISRNPFPQQPHNCTTDFTLMLKYCHDPGSNRGHLDLQSNALPTELSWQVGLSNGHWILLMTLA